MNHGAEFALYAMTLVLPLSALLARRVSMSQIIKMVVVWIAIFGIGVAVVGQRDRIQSSWHDIRAGLVGRDQLVVGRTVRVDMAPDGNFWATALINGVSRRMLVDSGATTTALSTVIADAARLTIDDGHFAEAIETANGYVMARRATIARMDLDGIRAIYQRWWLRNLAILTCLEWIFCLSCHGRLKGRISS